jgi:hypothetical protein
LNSPQVKIFPNPVTNILTIEQKETKNSTAEIYSVLGQKLHSYDLKEEVTTIDVSNFQNGIYLVLLISDEGIDTHTILKK